MKGHKGKGEEEKRPREQILRGLCSKNAYPGRKRRLFFHHHYKSVELISSNTLIILFSPFRAQLIQIISPAMNHGDYFTLLGNTLLYYQQAIDF